MSDPGGTDQALATLTMEYQRVCEEIRSIENQNDKIVGVGLTIIGAGVLYGLSQNLNEVFIALPFMLIAVLFWAVLQYHNLLRFGGYKRALEEEINRVLGRPVLVWELLLADDQRRLHVTNAPLITLYYVFLVAVSSYSEYRVFPAFGSAVGFIEGGSILGCLLILIFSVRRALRAFERAHEAATAHLSGRQ